MIPPKTISFILPLVLQLVLMTTLTSKKTNYAAGIEVNRDNLDYIIVKTITLTYSGGWGWGTKWRVVKEVNEYQCGHIAPKDMGLKNNDNLNRY